VRERGKLRTRLLSVRFGRSSVLLVGLEVDTAVERPGGEVSVRHDFRVERKERDRWCRMKGGSEGEGRKAIRDDCMR
jgi:hypothetical protein